MIRVVLESPLKAPTREGIEENKAYARLCVKDSLSRGEAPYASHLLFDQPGILNEQDLSERALGMRVGLEWGKMAEMVVVYADRGITPGMQVGIDSYRHQGIPVEVRYLYPTSK